jgi:hypothetical protein
MLEIVKSFQGRTASNAEAGDLNEFLRDVLVEAAGENYRQTMYEAMALAKKDRKKQTLELDPPLRANERVMSGLFATAISRSSLRSRSEVRIDRRELDLTADALDPDDDVEVSPVANHGRVDYLAWYGSRVVGIELKMSSINCQKPALSRQIIERWERVSTQAQTAQDYLRARQREDKARYPSPVSLSLMVVVGRRAVKLENIGTLNKLVPTMRDHAIQTLSQLENRPGFVASYTFPEEFRVLVRRRSGVALASGDSAIFTPFVIFLAKPAVNAKT